MTFVAARGQPPRLTTIPACNPEAPRVAEDDLAAADRGLPQERGLSRFSQTEASRAQQASNHQHEFSHGLFPFAAKY